MKLVAILLLLMAASQDLRQSRGAIEGYVLVPGNNQPVAQAHVVLAGGGTTVRTTSDDRGYFRFGNLVPAQYTLEVSRDGYAHKRDGVTEERSMQQVMLSLDRNLDPVLVPLVKLGEISGFVIDAYNQPVRNATVQLVRLQPGTSDGRLVPVTVKSGVTSDQGYGGSYLFTGVESGEYLVRVPERANNAVAVSDTTLYFSSGATSTVRYFRVDEKVEAIYFPGVASVLEASRVSVVDGGQVQADIRLPVPPPRSSISGSIVNTIRMTDVSSRMVFYFAVPADVPPQLWSTPVQLPVTNTGEFQISGLKPGRYHVFAGSAVGGIATSAGTVYATGIYPAGVTSVVISDADVAGVIITLADAVTITGRLSTQTADVPLDGLSVAFRPLKEFPVEAAVLRTTPRDPATPLHPEIRVARDGTFTATAVPVLYDVPPGAYVAAIRQGQTSLGTLHVLPQSNAPIEIAVNTDGWTVEGSVLNASNASSTVVLAAADPARSTYFKETTSAADGTFRFESVPPGEYRLAAFEKVILGAAYTQALMSKFPLSSGAVSVPPRSTVRVDIRVSARLAIP